MSALRKLVLFWALIVFHLSAVLAKAQAPLPIVVTLPVLKDWVDIIGGAHVETTTLISGLESEHSYSPKPSDMLHLQKARLLFKIGLGLESWVSTLIENTDRSDLSIITTSENVSLIEAVPDLDGHAHGAANPHIWLDPDNAKIMLRHILDALVNIDPLNAADYRQNATRYLEQLELLQAELQTDAASLKDRRLIVHHPAWPYFAKAFGFVIQDHILKQTGGRPSAKQIARLIRVIQKNKIQVIVSEPQLSPKVPQILSEETGATVVILSPLPGALPGTKHYLDLMRYNMKTLVTALQKDPS